MTNATPTKRETRTINPERNYLSRLYQTSLALLTDLYELTMAYGYWKTGMAEREAAFELEFRQPPFGGGFSIACGLGTLLQYLEDFCFSNDDLAYLDTLKAADGSPLFSSGFLRYLEDLRLTVHLFAMPEGTAVFPHEPIIRVQGPLLQAQILESVLLNIINYQTLIATRAARMKLAARGEPIIEFGLRRAQGIDGSISATRASFIGGCDATSNMLSGKLLGVPVRGTIAHSWVMAFDDELQAFEAYASAMPNNVLLLVDTYDTLGGIRSAALVGKKLKQQGRRLLGIRLDSGDLAWLSIEARKILDEAGLQDAQIFASNDLDEYVIESLKQQGALISVWGIGTRLVTGGECSALGGIYKLTALRNSQGEWEDKLKLSEQTVKVSTPGMHQVRRFTDWGKYCCDAIYDLALGIERDTRIVDPGDSHRSRDLPRNGEYRDLLVPVLQGGSVVYQSPSLHESQALTRRELEMLPEAVKRFLNPHAYPAGLEKKLHTRRHELMRKYQRAGEAD